MCTLSLQCGARRAGWLRVGSRGMIPVQMARKPPSTPPDSFDVQAFLKSAGVSARTVRFATGALVFSQGAQANSVFYVQDGGVKLSVLSSAGREAVVAMLGAGDFFGEGCLAGQALRMGTATTACRRTAAHPEARDGSPSARPAGVLGSIPHAHAHAQYPNRRGPGRSAVQLEREAARAHVLLLARYGKEDITHRSLPSCRRRLSPRWWGQRGRA